MELQNKLVSTLIQNQFPQLYRDFGPVLVEFVTAYYQWLEQTGNAVYYTRNFLDNHDIDKTADQFLTHYKQKYLPNIQLDTAVATKRLVKNAKSFYRARGTDRATEMFFRAVFDVDCEIYYPYQDVLIASSGKWVQNTYLEVSPLETNTELVNQEIVGLQSKATAYVDDYIRRRSNGRLIDLLYISAITGNFQTSELVTLANNINIPNAPTITGSLTGLEVVIGSEGFTQGDVVNVYSNTGFGAQAVVANTYTAVGFCDFNIVDGGWGYNSNSQILISDTVLRVTNVLRPVSYGSSKNLIFSAVSQPYANILFQNASSTFSVNDVLTGYYANGSISGQGTILQLNQTSNNGYLITSVTSGNLASNTTFYNQGNAVNAKIATSGYVDLTATGQLLNPPDYNTVFFTNATGVFLPSENIIQMNTMSNTISTGTANVINQNGSSGNILVVNSTIFFTGTNIIGETSGTTAYVNSLTLDLGIESNSTFTTVGNNTLSVNNYFTSGTVLTRSSGYGADFKIINDFDYNEVEYINTDLLSHYSSTIIGSAFGGLGAVIGTTLSYVNETIGTVTAITGINPGINYNFSPIVSIFTPEIYCYLLQDYVFNIANGTGIFSKGELITQSAMGKTGLVTFANSSTVAVRRLQMEEGWVATNNSINTMLVGKNSGYTASLVSYVANTASGYAGINAVITSNVVSSPGCVSNLKVIDSGFGFNRSLNVEGLDIDLVNFSSQDGTRIGTAFANLQKQGQSIGYWEDNNGFLSSNKKLYDGDYYQEFSYEIKTSLSPKTYQNMLNKLLHVAGKKWFGAVELISTLDSNTNISSVVETTTVPYLIQPMLIFSSLFTN